MIWVHKMWFTKKFLEMCNNLYLLLDFKCFLLFMFLTDYKFNINNNINIFMNSESRHSIRYYIRPNPCVARVQVQYIDKIHWINKLHILYCSKKKLHILQNHWIFISSNYTNYVQIKDDICRLTNYTNMQIKDESGLCFIEEIVDSEGKQRLFLVVGEVRRKRLWCLCISIN